MKITNKPQYNQVSDHLMVFEVNGKQYTTKNKAKFAIDYHVDVKNGDHIEAVCLYDSEQKCHKCVKKCTKCIKKCKLLVVDSEISEKIHKMTYKPRQDWSRRVGMRVRGTLVQMV